MTQDGANKVVTAQVIVSGRVQGVFFRDSTRRAAVAAGVSGWVRNLPDGSVEAVFQGERSAVAAVIGWCHQGPPSARVTDVQTEWIAQAPELSGFHVRQ